MTDFFEETRIYHIYGIGTQSWVISKTRRGCLLAPRFN